MTIDVQERPSRPTAAHGAGRRRGVHPRQLVASLPGRAAQARPAHQLRNPVMFVVWVGSVLVTVVRDRPAERVRDR